uniref:Uncharacterized protein n=1 Tax=Photinus pyralis TaxID=7054 RepID=A0A1Y1MLA2_PHOPY
MSTVLWRITLLCVLLQATHVLSEYFDNEHAQRCREENKVEISDLEGVFDENDIVVRSDSRLHALMLCMYQRQNLIKDGKYVRDAVIKHIAERPTPIDVAEKVFDKCRTEDEEVTGEIAINLRNCLIKEIGEYFASVKGSESNDTRNH